jgi:ribosomal protein S18 acetylase RimI-like enzyme
MIIRIAHEADAPAMGHVTVDTYLAAHREQIPAAAWEKRAQEWTPAVSERAWRQTLHDIAADADSRDCIYVAVEEDTVVGLAMGGLAETDGLPRTGEVYVLYVRASHQGRGLGRRLVQAVAADLARHGITALQIGCLAANAPARRFYESLGGQPIGERMFDEEGTLLPEVVYGWADTTTLIGAIGSRGRI